MLLKPRKRSPRGFTCCLRPLEYRKRPCLDHTKCVSFSELRAGYQLVHNNIIYIHKSLFIVYECIIWRLSTACESGKSSRSYQFLSFHFHVFLFGLATRFEDVVPYLLLKSRHLVDVESPAARSSGLVSG